MAKSGSIPRPLLPSGPPLANTVSAASVTDTDSSAEPVAADLTVSSWITPDNYRSFVVSRIAS